MASAILLASCNSEEPPTARRPEPTSGQTEISSPEPTRQDARPFSAQRVDLGLEVVLEGLDDPLLVTHSGDGSGSIFVVEQTGRILIAPPNEQPSVFLEVTGLTDPGGEQGLLGLAFHPDYENNGRFFVNYTDDIGDTIVAEYERASETRADPDSARVLMEIDQPFPNHNGGHLAFGPDGYLYIGMGDGGGGGDPEENGQDPEALLGKMLRIDVDRRGSDKAYATPADNMRGARPEIWALGLRNPWRFSFDRETGDLWIGDVGQDNFEEINFTRAGESAGLNYGWDVMEGRGCFEPATACDSGGLEFPVAQFSHELGCSVTGGYVYRGRRFKDMVGGYFFGDYCSGRIWVLDADDPQAEMVELAATEASISSFGEDEDGELYLSDQSTGTVFRLIDRS
jgi:glucose/arabinose dehydrogenase